CFYFFTIRRSSTTTLFPYTTLFRSEEMRQLEKQRALLGNVDVLADSERQAHEQELSELAPHIANITTERKQVRQGLEWYQQVARSEEHTSELQSRFDLVCRLLLEKK